MNYRDWSVFIAAVMLMVCGSLWARSAGPQPYVTTDAQGKYYARCIPNFDGGKTTIYRVRRDKDEVVEEHDWYEKGYASRRIFIIEVGWDRKRQKPLLAIFRHHAARDPAKPEEQIEFSIYLGGKLVQSYTTKALKKLGAATDVEAGLGRRPEGTYAVYKLRCYDRFRQGKTSHGCFSIIIGKHIVLIDVATGKIVSKLPLQKAPVKAPPQSDD